MKIRWSREASDRLLDHPRLGELLDRYGGREIRHLHVGDYDMRYEFDGEVISIIRIWHDREDR